MRGCEQPLARRWLLSYTRIVAFSGGDAQGFLTVLCGNVAGNLRAGFLLLPVQRRAEGCSQLPPQVRPLWSPVLPWMPPSEETVAQLPSAATCPQPLAVPAPGLRAGASGLLAPLAMSLGLCSAGGNGGRGRCPGSCAKAGCGVDLL